MSLNLADVTAPVITGDPITRRDRAWVSVENAAPDYARELGGARKTERELAEHVRRRNFQDLQGAARAFRIAVNLYDFADSFCG